MKYMVKKWWVLAIIAVAVAFLLEIVQINSWPRPVELAISEESKKKEVSIDPKEDIEFHHYELTETGIKPVDSDPQMLIELHDLELCSDISFYFSTPTPDVFQVRVLWPEEDHSFTESNSQIIQIPTGIQYWHMDIPEGEYHMLQLEINSVSGSVIPLASIGLSDGVTTEMTMQEPKIHPIRLAVVAILLFAVLFWLTWCKVWQGMGKAIHNGIRGIKAGKLKSVLYALVFPAAIGLSIFLFWVFCSVLGDKTMTMPRIVFSGLIGLFAACLFVFRKTLMTQPEYLFLILMVCLGFLFSYYVPHSGINGWDEDYHYTQALKTSYVDSLIMTPQDHATVARTVPYSFDLNGGIEELYTRQDNLYRSEAMERYPTAAEIKAWPELFNGIGLYIGRILGVRYYMIHFMGRFTGLLCYAFLGFFAMRKLKSGKMIVAAAFLIPTEVFIACSYNYDSYLTGFTAVGLCYYMAQWQDRNAKVTLKDTIIMIGTIAFGCLTKVVYIPLMLIILLLPKDKFKSRKLHTWYVLSILAVSAFVAISCLIPDMIKGTSISDGDIRGGDTVSVRGQLSFILKDPGKFVGIVWRYITNEWFYLGRVGELLTNMAYHGIMPNQFLYLAILVAVAFTDKNEYDRELAHHPWAHIWPILVSMATIVIVITVMYLEFTPIGTNRVNGAQFRYMVPMVLPIMLHIGSGLVENKMNRAWYNGLVLSALAFVGFSVVYHGFIIKYF